MGILNQFMKEQSHSNVMLVMQHFYKGRLNGHIKLVHEGKQPFKCNDFTKQNMNGHINYGSVASVAKGKSSYSHKYYKQLTYTYR